MSQRHLSSESIRNYSDEYSETIEYVPVSSIVILIAIEIVNATTTPVHPLENDMFQNDYDHGQCPKAENQYHWSSQLINCQCSKDRHFPARRLGNIKLTYDSVDKASWLLDLDLAQFAGKMNSNPKRDNGEIVTFTSISLDNVIDTHYAQMIATLNEQ